MLAQFQTVATARVAQVQGPQDGLMSIFVRPGRTYMGLPIGWDGVSRVNPRGQTVAPYMLLSLTPAHRDAVGVWVPEGNPVTFRASATFLADYGIVSADDVRAILNGNNQYIIRCIDGGRINVNGRDITIVTCDLFQQVDDNGSLVNA